MRFSESHSGPLKRHSGSLQYRTERVLTTLEHWGVEANEVFFLGGMQKDRILQVLKSHMYFDDQRSHLESAAGNVPMVHIPFGVANS